MNASAEILVSVIVPNYNHATLLPQRLQSIFAQTHKNIEVVLLDDASTDDSLKILEVYKANPLVKAFICNTTNSGGTPYLQWQKGISLCSGQWVWIAESDDWCEPTFLESLLCQITPNCTLAFAQSMVLQGNTVMWNSTAKQLYQIIPGRKFFNDRMLSGNGIFNASMAIFRRSALEHFDFEYAALSYLGDWAFWATIAASGDVLCCARVLNYFTQNEGVSATSNKGGKYYTDYPVLLSYFQSKGWITTAQKKTLLGKMYQRSLSEKKLNEAARSSVQNVYSTMVPTARLKIKWQMQQAKIKSLRLLGL